MYLLRRPMLALSARTGIRDAVSTAPLTGRVVERFIAGETLEDAVTAVERLRADGLTVTLDHLGENTADRAGADAAVQAYLDVLNALADAGLVGDTEVSVKLSAVGGAVPVGPDAPSGGAAIARENARRIAAAAYGLGARMTLDMEDHRTVDDTLQTLFVVRRDHPDVGVAVQAMLRRAPQDLTHLTGPGSRVRLVKGAYDEPEDVAFTDRHEVDLAYVRCLQTLMAGRGYPMVGSHDPRIVDIAGRLAADHHRPDSRWEHQMLFGIRPDEQRRLHAQGRRVRVYVPYGTDWYGYFVRRLAERPANLTFFLRSLVGRD